MNYSETKYRLAIVLAVVAILATLGISAPPKSDAGPSIPRVGDLAPPPPPQLHAATPDVPPAQKSKVKPPFSLNGKATWYGKALDGRETASGERYDMFRFTAAHRNLPFGTLLRVTNRRNGKWVVVRVTDRGPVASGRVLDLSYAAARQIGMLEDGIVSVRIEKFEPTPPPVRTAPVQQAKLRSPQQ